MKTIYIDESFFTNRENHEPCVMVLGFFDGIHLGHRALIDAGKKIAGEKQLKLAVMTFFPHPSNILPVKNKITSYLTPLADKQRLLKNLGVDTLYIVKFTEQFAGHSPDEFIQRYVAGLNCRHVVAGFDFTYGHKGKGNMERIKSDGKGLFDVTTVPKKVFKHEKISSTKIRALLDEGKVDDVHHFLGSHYRTVGIVESQSFDRASGKTLAHIVFQDYYLPKKGGYIVETITEDTTVDSICLLHDIDSGVLMLEESVLLQSFVTVKWLAKLEALSRMNHHTYDRVAKKIHTVI